MAYSFQNKASSSAVTVGELNQVVNGVERPYRVYTALLTQSGINPPVATVLENTIGDIVFTYDSDGQYYGELIDGFVEGKTFILVSNAVKDVLNGNIGIIQCLNANTLIIESYDGSGATLNGVFSNTPIEIRVYN